MRSFIIALALLTPVSAFASSTDSTIGSSMYLPNTAPEAQSEGYTAGVTAHRHHVRVAPRRVEAPVQPLFPNSGEPVRSGFGNGSMGDE